MTHNAPGPMYAETDERREGFAELLNRQIAERDERIAEAEMALRELYDAIIDGDRNAEMAAIDGAEKVLGIS